MKKLEARAGCWIVFTVYIRILVSRRGDPPFSSEASAERGVCTVYGSRDYVLAL